MSRGQTQTTLPDEGLFVGVIKPEITCARPFDPAVNNLEHCTSVRTGAGNFELQKTGGVIATSAWEIIWAWLAFIVARIITAVAQTLVNALESIMEECPLHFMLGDQFLLLGNSIPSCG